MAYVLSQINQMGIPPLLHRIESYEQWIEKLSEVRRIWLDYIGELPARVPVRVQVKSQSKQSSHTRFHVEYDTVYGDRITAYILIPDENVSNRPRNAGYPAVIALHSTNEQGKDFIALSTGGTNRMYAVELVERGYVVLVPDALTAGERIYPGRAAFESEPFYEQYPEWSTVAKNLTDHLQGIDVLCSLDYVNPNAIGAIGHSFGGYNAYFLAGMDDRIKAVVSSCGFSPFTGDPHPEHWGYRPYPYTHIPKVSADLQQDRIPFEFHEIVALCAPTPFLNYAGQDDHIFPHWKSVGEGMLELSRLYRWLGKEDRFQSYLGTGGHDFPEEIRMLAYLFLDQWLKKEGE
ncbi:prolyl oligopeptidase family serine peptidase [Paenibacillus sp. LMG 31458]|uniref:Prolyl oligopeptidase family serine peptidase n=1 Tax=Paenibacillus phytorum TaxID=2654977 RepID=A0ABX1XXG7_9BACL|nr:prolyl oligopeptidase family serine peptidase [Paenibacillus phytorum]NOU73233.1 prolyl oligopeptidase family serine peptidase [Paenibacillus phytorum]